MIIAQNGSQSVKTIKSSSGEYISNVYVNYGETITGVTATHKTLAGATKWAAKQVA